MTTRTQATIEDLYNIPDHGKAELVDGEIVLMSPTGYLPNYAASEIFVSLRNYARRSPQGYAIADNAGFKVDLPNRKSFSPDAAWYTGQPGGMQFLEGAPAFAVEVRSEGDYGSASEVYLLNKRRDYFAAGTLCVWDVDLLGSDVIKSYHSADPLSPIIFRHGDLADAGPAVPGWSMPVDNLFPANK